MPDCLMLTIYFPDECMYLQFCVVGFHTGNEQDETEMCDLVNLSFPNDPQPHPQR